MLQLGLALAASGRGTLLSGHGAEAFVPFQLITLPPSTFNVCAVM